MKLLIAHDGSAQSAALVADLPRCGLPPAGQALVLSVADAWTATEGDVAPAYASAVAGAGAAVIKAALEQAKSISERARDAVAAQLPGWRVDAESLAGSPSWEIIRRADEWRPDLVVIGATGTSRLERIVFGTTTSQVVGHLRCSVRVARPRKDHAAPIRIVLGCDGSTQALAAAQHVATRHWPAGTEVRVVTAVDAWLLAALEGPEGAEDDAQARVAAGKVPSIVTPVLTKAGLEVTEVVREGDPKRMLIDEADAWNADCIVVGARGRRGLARLLLGSVALATSSRARCSVEVVREDDARI